MYARISEKNGKKQYLQAHLENVSRYCGKKLEPIGLKNLGILMGFCHDFGKIAPQWQEYLLSGQGSVSHASGGVHFLRRLSLSTKETPFQGFLLELLELAIQGHHGGLRDALSVTGERNQVEENVYSVFEEGRMDQWFFQEIASQETILDLMKKAEVELKNILKSMKKQVKSSQSPSFQGAENQCFQMQIALLERLVHSVLIDADRFDAADFDDKIDVTPPTPWEDFLEKLENHDFQKDGINAYRTMIAEEAKAFPSEKRGIYQFSAPTGAGKTLSSLGFALKAAKSYEKERIFFIAPFLTILEQNADSVRNVLGLEKNSPILLEHHSNFVVEAEKAEKLSQRHLSTEHWDCQIIFTSLVAFLNTGFRGDSGRRFQGLVNSVIIIDEIQSIPTHCLYFFHSYLHFLRDFCNCVILTTTATPPTLPQHFFQLDYAKPKEIVHITEEIKRAFQRTFFQVLEGTWDDNQISALILEKHQEFQRVLCVVNTKSTAFSLYSLVKNGTSIPVIYLSTELCPSHRQEKIKVMKQLLFEKKPVICISTQVIEAGVDISFPTVIRTMAGLDSLIQAAGRCNRHGEGEIAPVFVIHSSSEKLEKLSDIEKGRKVTNELWTSSQEIPLESEKALEYYFKNFYFDQENHMNNGLFQQFGMNPKGRQAFYDETEGKYSMCMAQAFQTVGRKFLPIKDNTTAVIVPYGEAFSLIDQLKEAQNSNEKRAVYRKLQRYAVNVYEHKLGKLLEEGAIYYEKTLELWCMNQGFYVDTTGIQKKIDIDQFIL